MEENSKKNIVRSVAYPGVSLSQALDFTKRLRESLGAGPYSRNEIAKALGHVKLTGPAGRKVAALVHFGLLSRTGNVYKQSELANDIINPLSDDDRNAAIVTAALTPKLFHSLAEKFDNQAVPSMLANILMREGVGEGAAPEAAQIFIESMETAGLISNGVISTKQSETSASNTEDVLSQPTQLGDPVVPVVAQEQFSRSSTALSEVPIAEGKLILKMPLTFKDLLLNSDDETLEEDWKSARKALKKLAEHIDEEDNESGI